MTGDRVAIESLARPPDATVNLPGSKSLTNRALLCAALAEGISTLTGVLVADDTAAMLDAVEALGATVVAAGERVTVTGIGAKVPPQVGIDAADAGTVARFVTPVLATGAGEAMVDGSLQLRRRPMGPLLDALRQLGVVVDEAGSPGHLPVSVHGPVTGDHVSLPGDVSSQFVSGLLLAGPLMPRGLTVALTTELVARPFVAMTAAVMGAFGAVASVAERECMAEPGGYRAGEYRIEPDASAASYFLAAAAVTGGRVRVEGLGPSSLQGDLRFVDVLEAMGASVDRGANHVEVTGDGLHGVDVDLGELPDMVPTLAVVAAFADGATRVRGIGFVRGHESDRLAAVVEELGRCGVDAVEHDDGFEVRPSGHPHAAVVDSHGDHRIAMAFALVGLRVAGIEIDDAGVVAKTFPGYFDVLASLRR